MKTSHLVTVTLLALFCGVGAIAADKPSIDLNWYGYIKLDGSYDQNLTSHGNFVMWVAQKSADGDDEQFNMTANQTRFGVKAAGKNYGRYSVGGNIEFDLYARGGGVTQTKAQLQLRHAFVSLGSGNTKFIAGQTWDMVSPLNPATLNYAVAWGCGNIGYRRPQLALVQEIPYSKNTTFKAGAGFFRTIGSDLTPTFSLAAGEAVDGSDDGTDAGIPSFQGIFEMNSKISKSSLQLGVSGLWGQLKAETNLGNSEEYESWAVNGHFNLAVSTNWGFSGEVWTGSNLQGYNGGVLNDSQIDGLEAVGGWAAAWLKVSEKVKLSSGFGMDDPDDEQLNANARCKNQNVYGNITYAIVPQASVGLELSQWQTEYKGADTEKDLRVQTSVQLNF